MISVRPQDICDDYGFHFLDDVAEPAAKLVGVGRELRYSKSYFWDNRERPEGYLLQYTLSGSGTLVTREGRQVVRPGQVFWLKMPEEERYYFDEEENEAPWEFLYVMFSCKGLLPYYEYFVRHFGKVAELGSYHPAIRALQELHLKAREGKLQSPFAAGAAVFELMCLLCETPERRQQGASALAEQAMDYMREHFAQEMSLAAMAEALQVSQSHLSREFVKATGEQPIRYLTRLRLEKAVALLNASELTIQEISGCCGFSDSNYFCKVFRRYFKASPGEFRRQVQALGYVNIRT